ncbi:hypothetical protein HK103_005614 [Boothiomyces macroporosus]|uniref:Endoplasmic reticulum transmembrane protein n=1 Tax=Boothiomyces macroporosus TaxID=261099 RepID=A0AAD5UF00_9FUNG|nr:hypothetical protein HK103_005614 [Boothiomyces macroporosus]
MSILYQGVFAMLVAEMLVFLLLLAPLPYSVRTKIIQFFIKSPIAAQIKYGLRIIFVLVCILFVDNVNRSFKTQEKHDQHEEHAHMDSRTDSYLHSKMFQAQRNMYLTGSVIFLSLVLNRFVNMINELAKNEEKTEILKQQAAKTTKEYLKLLDKEQKNDSKELQEKYDKLVKEFEILKKQANQTNDEYMKLTDKYVDLENKFENNSASKKDK